MGMPTISVFIRKNDLEKFKALENKSEFIHNALNASRIIPPSFHVGSDQVDPSGDGGATPPASTKCKHGYDPRFCKFAKYDKTRKEKWCK